MPEFPLGLSVILAFVTLGIGCGLVIAYELRTGRTLMRKHISRAKEPFEFFISILVTAIFGCAFLAIGASLFLKSL